MLASNRRRDCAFEVSLHCLAILAHAGICTWKQGYPNYEVSRIGLLIFRTLATNLSYDRGPAVCKRRDRRDRRADIIDAVAREQPSLHSEGTRFCGVTTEQKKLDSGIRPVRADRSSSDLRTSRQLCGLCGLCVYKRQALDRS